MSYFCARTVTVDRETSTCKVKGGDNNIVPRSNYWSGPIPLTDMLRLVDSGGVKFTTRSDKNLWFEQTVELYAKKMVAALGISPYDAGRLPSDPADLPRKQDEWRKSVVAGTWEADVCQRLLEITANPDQMLQLEDIKREFTSSILAGPSKEKRIVRHGTTWVYRVKPTKISLCFDRKDAKHLSVYLAAEIVRRFPDVVIEPV